MKNLKLGIFSLLAILAVSVFLTSCEQEIVETPIDEVDRVQQLKSDPNYITLISLNNELLSEISNAMAIKNVTGEDLKNMYVNEQTDLLEAFFEDTQVESIMNNISPISRELSSEYSDLIAASSDFDESALVGLGNLHSSNLESRGCTWQQSVCVSGALAGYFACFSATSGFGAYLCYVAYAATVTLCFNTYCQF